MGALDLVVAVALGVLSAPGTPFRVFTDEPGTVAMAALPWIMVPALLLPLYLLIHFTIAIKLRSWPPASAGARRAGAARPHAGPGCPAQAGLAATTPEVPAA